MIPPVTGALQRPQREGEMIFLRARPLVGAAAGEQEGGESRERS